MRLFILLNFYLFISSIYSCNSITLDWNWAVHKAYNNEAFNPKVFKEFKIYDTIKSIMVYNMDTIYKLRNTNHQFYYKKRNFEEKKLRQNQILDIPIYLYNESPTPDTISLNDLPPYIYQKVDSLLNEIEAPRTISFMKTGKHPIFIIDLTDSYDMLTDVEIKHMLVWHWSPLQFPFKFKKDTILSGDWKYFILCYYKNGDNLK